MKIDKQAKNIITAFVILQDAMNNGPMSQRRREIREFKYLGMLRQGKR